jgi:hypothetical protein
MSPQTPDDQVGPSLTLSPYIPASPITNTSPPSLYQQAVDGPAVLRQPPRLASPADVLRKVLSPILAIALDL